MPSSNISNKNSASASPNRLKAKRPLSARPGPLTRSEIESLRRDAQQALASLKEAFTRNPLPPEYLKAGRKA